MKEKDDEMIGRGCVPGPGLRPGCEHLGVLIPGDLLHHRVAHLHTQTPEGQTRLNHRMCQADFCFTFSVPCESREWCGTVQWRGTRAILSKLGVPHPHA